MGRGGAGGGAARDRGFYEPSGGPALPGTYKVVMEYGDASSESSIKVHSDPRISSEMANLQARENFIKEVEGLSSGVMKATKQLDDAKKTIDKLLAFAKDVDDEEVKELVKLANETKKKIDTTREAFYGPTREGQGIVRNLYPTTMTMLFAPRYYAGSSFGAPGATEQRLMQHAKESAEEAMKVYNAFLENDWKPFEEKARATKIDIFGVMEK
jgi:hypothetical protein